MSSVIAIMIFVIFLLAIFFFVLNITIKMFCQKIKLIIAKEILQLQSTTMFEILKKLNTIDSELYNMKIKIVPQTFSEPIYAQLDLEGNKSRTNNDNEYQNINSHHESDDNNLYTTMCQPKPAPPPITLLPK